jgi:ATP adenylyltransferase/5',5'''-P-1,P-4-tetraphosphate phosphorylase II
LFRDKARLVDEGKLPSSYWRKRKTDTEDLKRSRLEEAVAACKDGKMSQATASVTYQIPKTTIWRRLQKDIKKEVVPIITKLHMKNESPQEKSPETIKAEELNEADFEAYCPVRSPK